MPAASILIKPASSNCNIDCKYCFYKCLSSNREKYSMGFMSLETIEKVVIRAFEYAEHHVTFAFQGGEPTLSGLPFFREVVKLQEKYRPSGISVENTIQTNGILIDREWARFLSENHFLVGLSLDGPQKLHDRYRRDVKDSPTFEKVMQTIALFDEFHIDYNILSVVTADTCDKAGYLYKFYKRNQFQFIQLIPCMDEKNRGKSGPGSEFTITAEKYGKFLCEIFDLWYEDFVQDRAAGRIPMDIRMFSNLAQLAAGYPAEECGMNGRCTCYFVVEGDGSVYPCDFYCMDKWKLGSVDESFNSMINSDKAKEFVSGSCTVNEKCKSCPHFRLCRGGCRRWRESGGENLSLFGLCPAYEIFFEHASDRIGKLGQIILDSYGEYRG